jgi:hypothetical protein
MTVPRILRLVGLSRPLSIHKPMPIRITAIG